MAPEGAADAPAPPTASSPQRSGIAAAAGVEVEVVAVNDPCWVLAAEDGREVWARGRVLEVGERMVLTAKKRVFLRLGNPGAVELIFNGRNLGSPGGDAPVNLTFPDDAGTF